MFTAYLQTTKVHSQGCMFHTLQGEKRVVNSMHLFALIWSSLQFSSENFPLLEIIYLGPHTMLLFPPSLEIAQISSISNPKIPDVRATSISTHLIAAIKVIPCPSSLYFFKDFFLLLSEQSSLDSWVVLPPKSPSCLHKLEGLRCTNVLFSVRACVFSMKFGVTDHSVQDRLLEQKWVWQCILHPRDAEYNIWKTKLAWSLHDFSPDL